MNTSIEKAGYILCIFLAFVFFLNGFMKPQPPPVPASLHVPFVYQIGNNWCWAACSEMVSKYYHQKIDSLAPVFSQCMLAKSCYSIFGTMTCPVFTADSIPSACDSIGSTPFCFGPNYTGKNYSFFITPTEGTALSWDSLCAQIADSMPVIFQWGIEGITAGTQNWNGMHFLVAEGCPHSSYFDSPGWVSIHDPLPPGQGRHRIITYAEYANMRSTSLPGDSSKYVFCFHGWDRYAFKYE